MALGALRRGAVCYASRTACSNPRISNPSAIELGNAFRRDLTRKTRMTPDVALPDVEELLPHRYPFLLVDRITAIVPGKRAVGVRQVTADEWFTGQAGIVRNAEHIGA